MDDANYDAALEEAEALALENNYLGADFDVSDDEGTSRTEVAAIAERARGNHERLATGIDHHYLELNPGHEARPIWVVPTGDIYLETNSKYFELATDFLVAISNPESRPELIHHYKLTPYSLYAAVSVNLDTETILRTLTRFSKTHIPHQVEDFIKACTASHGKAKLVLKRSRLYVESRYPSVLKQLLKVKDIRESKEDSTAAQWERQMGTATAALNQNGSGGAGLGLVESEAATENAAAAAVDLNQLEELEMMERRVANVDEENDEEDESMAANQETRQLKTQQQCGTGRKRPHQDTKNQEATKDEATASSKVVSFEIKPENIEQVKEAAMQSDFPLMEEYDFRGDDRNPDLDINLKASTKVRPYQEKSLAKMFGNGRARSGVIVLPCGAGKTLTGITAASTIKKSCIFFCINAVGVEQWIRSVKAFTTVSHDHIRRFTSKTKDDLHPSGATILVTTYNMMSYSKSRSEEGARVMDQVKQTEWGLIVMDEVHVVPAAMFRKALRFVHSHCKLGLTATLVREDNLIDDLNFLIGPKLYEANWLKLTNEGFLAKVLCAEVWCPMTAEFFEDYLSNKRTVKEKQLLYVMNPNKFAICRMLMEYHRNRKDKVLIFSDNIPAIKRYSSYLKVYNMYGDTSHYEREEVLRRFRGGPGVRPEEEIHVLLISQVGDVGIDLPQANVIIQIASHFGSRRQEAQRLGRILRPKAGDSFNVGWNAFFYSLISMDTAEMYFSHKRQKYLVDQGYTFKVIRNIKKIAREGGIPYEELSMEEQHAILRDLYAEKVSESLKLLQDKQMGNSSGESSRSKLTASKSAKAQKLLSKIVKSRKGW